MALSADQVYALARGAGLAPGRAVVATAVSGYQGSPNSCESGGNPQAHNAVPPDDSWGLWQINMLGTLGPTRRIQFGISSNNELLNPRINARAMAIISGNGLNFTPWTTYVSGCYRANLAGAQAAAQRVDKLTPGQIQTIIGAIASGVGSATSGGGSGLHLPNPLKPAADLASTLFNLYKWLPGPPAPDAEAVAAAKHGLLRIGEVLGGVILFIIGIRLLLEPAIKPAAQAARTAAKVAAVAA